LDFVLFPRSGTSRAHPIHDAFYQQWFGFDEQIETAYLQLQTFYSASVLADINLMSAPQQGFNVIGNLDTTTTLLQKSYLATNVRQIDEENY